MKNIWGKIFNVFSENITINEIAKEFSNIYKKLEIIHINQDQNFHSLILRESRLIDKIINMNLSSYNIKSVLNNGFAIVDKNSLKKRKIIE